MTYKQQPVEPPQQHTQKDKAKPGASTPKGKPEYFPHGNSHSFSPLSPLVAQVTGNDILKKPFQGLIMEQFCLKGQLVSS